MTRRTVDPTDGDDVRIAPDGAPPERRAPFRRSRPAIAAAAFLIVLGIGAVPDLVGDSPTPAESPVETGERFVEAHTDWDIDTAIGLLALNVELVDHRDWRSLEPPAPASIRGVYPAKLNWMRATGWRWESRGCELTHPGPPASVRCLFAYENAWSRALGVGPYEGSELLLEIEDGRIHRSELFVNTGDHSTEVFDFFLAWVDENHPDDLRVLFDGSCCRVALTTDSIDRWQTLTREFVEEHAG